VNAAQASVAASAMRAAPRRAKAGTVCVTGIRGNAAFDIGLVLIFCFRKLSYPLDIYHF
jgi:hypothetical protein